MVASQILCYDNMEQNYLLQDKIVILWHLFIKWSPKIIKINSEVKFMDNFMGYFEVKIMQIRICMEF